MSSNNDHNQATWATENDFDENKSQMSWRSSDGEEDAPLTGEVNGSDSLLHIESSSGDFESRQHASRLNNRHPTVDSNQESVASHSYHSYDRSAASNSYPSQDRSAGPIIQSDRSDHDSLDGITSYNSSINHVGSISGSEAGPSLQHRSASESQLAKNSNISFSGHRQGFDSRIRHENSKVTYSEESAHGDRSSVQDSTEGYSVSNRQIPVSGSGLETESTNSNHISIEPKMELSQSVGDDSKILVSSEGNATVDSLSDQLTPNMNSSHRSDSSFSRSVNDSKASFSSYRGSSKDSGKDADFDQVSADSSKRTLSNYGDAGSMREVASEGSVSGDKLSNQTGSVARSYAGDSCRSHRSSGSGSSTSRSLDGSKASFSSYMGSSKHNGKDADFDQVSADSSKRTLSNNADAGSVREVASEGSVSGDKLLNQTGSVAKSHASDSHRSHHGSSSNSSCDSRSRSLKGPTASFSSYMGSSKHSGEHADFDQVSTDFSKRTPSNNGDAGSMRKVASGESVSGDRLSNQTGSVARSDASDSRRSHRSSKSGGGSSRSRSLQGPTASFSSCRGSSKHSGEDAGFDQVSAHSRNENCPSIAEDSILNVSEDNALVNSLLEHDASDSSRRSQHKTENDDRPLNDSKSSFSSNWRGSEPSVDNADFDQRNRKSQLHNSDDDKHSIDSRNVWSRNSDNVNRKEEETMSGSASTARSNISPSQHLFENGSRSANDSNSASLGSRDESNDNENTIFDEVCSKSKHTQSRASDEGEESIGVKSWNEVTLEDRPLSNDESLNSSRQSQGRLSVLSPSFSSLKRSENAYSDQDSADSGNVFSHSIEDSRIDASFGGNVSDDRLSHHLGSTSRSNSNISLVQSEFRSVNDGRSLDGSKSSLSRHEGSSEQSGIAEIRSVQSQAANEDNGTEDFYQENQLGDRLPHHAGSSQRPNSSSSSQSHVIFADRNQPATRSKASLSSSEIRSERLSRNQESHSADKDFRRNVSTDADWAGDRQPKYDESTSRSEKSGKIPEKGSKHSSSNDGRMESKNFDDEIYLRENVSDSNMPRDHMSHDGNEHASRSGSGSDRVLENPRPSAERRSQGDRGVDSFENSHPNKSHSQPPLSVNAKDSSQDSFQEGKELDDGSKNKAFSVISSASGHSKPLVISFESDDDLPESEIGDEFELLATGARLNGNVSRAPTEDRSSIDYEVRDSFNTKAVPEHDSSYAPSEEKSFGIEELMADGTKNELKGIREEGNEELNEKSSYSREKDFGVEAVMVGRGSENGRSDGSTSGMEANHNANGENKDGEYNAKEKDASMDDSLGTKESNSTRELEVASVLSTIIDEEEGIKVPLLSDNGDMTNKSQNTSKSSEDSAIDSSFVSGESISQHSKLAFMLKEGGSAEEENKLPDSIFSFLISSSTRREPYILAILVLLFKFAILIMLIANLTEKKTLISDQNPLGVPISSSWPVAACQILSLIIAVLAQDDLLNGLTLWRAGNFSGARLLVDEQASRCSEGNEIPFDGVSKCKWSAAILAQCFVGLATLVSTFLLVVTSPDVASVLLTFSIVTFISKIDNGLFVLAKNGLLGNAVTNEARIVTYTSYTLPVDEKKKSFLRSFMPTFVFLFSLLPMLVGWIYLFYQQSNGSFWPQVLVLQFDDTYDADLGYVSGLYALQSNPLRYEKGAARIMFCGSKRSWTIRIEGEDPCRSVIAMSGPQETGIMDIIASAQNDWFAPSQHGSDTHLISIQNVFLAEPCSSDEDCGGPERGACEKTGCKCRNDFYGINCGFESKTTCRILEVDEQTSTFRSTRTLSSYYEVLSNKGIIIQASQHPVFIGNSSKNDLDVMLYTGLRWVITRARDLVGNVDDPALALVRFFDGSTFDATKHLRVVDQRTAPVRFNSALDRSAPLDLPWAPLDPATSVLLSIPETRVICKACDNFENKCLNGGICLPGGTCQCTNRAKGDLCQIAPIGDGYCDHPFFNTALYDFDGGDCCATTCSSSNAHACGQVSLSDRLQESFVGFPFCRNPAAQGCAGSSICWSPTGEDLSYISGGRGTFLTLSANGRSIVVAEPSLDTIRVFDQVAEKWVLRGQAFKSNLPVHFGSRVAISTPPRNVFLQRVGKVPITLAASMKGNLPALRVYEWRALNVEWSQVCSDIVIDCDGNDCEIQEISLGEEGRRGVLAAALKNKEVYVYEVLFDIGKCTLKWTTTGTTLHVSGNGERLAVATPTYPSYLDSSSIAIFDVSEKVTADLQLDYSRDSLLSETYEKFLQSRIFSFALSYDGRTINIARVEDSSVTIDTLTQKDLYREIKSARTVLAAGQLSIAEIEDGISTLRFSSDGNALGVKSDDNLIYVANYAENREPLWTVRSTPFLSSELGFDFGVSSKGMIASAEDDMIETVGLSKVCGEDESSIFISLKLDDSPEDISWYLEQVGVDRGLTFSNTTYLWCQECYDDDEFQGTVVLETVCVPTRIINCIRLTFQSRKRRFADTVTAFADGVDFVSYNGEAGKFTFLPSDTFSFSQDCSATLIDDNVNPKCSASEKLLVASITTSLNPQETEWKLETLDTEREVSKGGSYDAGLKTFSENFCVRPDAECYVFTISGYNNIELFLKDENGGYEMVGNSVGLFPGDQQQEIYFGRDCPSTSVPTKAPVDSVFSIRPTPSGLQTMEPTLFVQTNSPATVRVPTRVPTRLPTLIPTLASNNPASISGPASQEPVLIISPLTPFPTVVSTTNIKEIEISIIITLGNEPEETGWTLSDNTNQNKVVEVTAGTYRTPNSKERESVIIETGKSYLFCVTDTGRDGLKDGRFSVNFRGWPLVLDNGQFENERCHEIKVAPGEVVDIIRSFGEKRKLSKAAAGKNTK